MVLYGVNHESRDVNKVMLVVVDTTSIFIFTSPLPSKVRESVASNLLVSCYTSGAPQEILCSVGGERTPGVMKYLRQ